MGFPELCMFDEQVLHNVLKFVQGLKSFTITVKFNDKEIPSVDDASDELLTHCVRHCRSLRRFTVHWIRIQERKLDQWEAHSFFVRRVPAWTGVTENSDRTLSSLAGREDRLEHHESVEWDDARPSCPSFSQIPSFF